MTTFYKLISNNLAAILAGNFVWFAISFWVYVETESVLTAAIFNAVFIAISASLSFWFGSIIDHNKKKTVLIASNLLSLIFFTLATIFYTFTPTENFKEITSISLWIFLLLNLLAIVSNNIRAIITPTLVTLLVDENKRDKMNGFSGLIMGIAGSAAGIFSGLALAYSGILLVQITTVLILVVSLIQLILTKVPEPKILNLHPENETKKSNISSTIKTIKNIDGLFPLIFYTTFNNLLGGVFLALLDPYGIELTSVRDWGIMWGVLSTGFILGGLIITKKGVGKNPIQTLFLINIIIWINSIIFPSRESVILLGIGVFIWTLFYPYIEAIEQTIIQKMVPYQKQGRVFGLAQTIEMSASPLTAMIIAPIANFYIIPSMTDGYLASTIGQYFGTGTSRAIALIFIAFSFVGLTITIFTMFSRRYRQLSSQKH